MIIHAVSSGYALCGFSTEVPSKWPEGNTWVSADDIELVTCEVCKERAIEMMNDLKNPRI